MTERNMDATHRRVVWILRMRSGNPTTMSPSEREVVLRVQSGNWVWCKH